MAHAIRPMFARLRIGLHLLVVTLTFLVIAHAVLTPSSTSAVIITLALVLLASYAVGGWMAQHPPRRAFAIGWLVELTLLWVALLWLAPEAAYLAFPLFFLDMHVFGPRWGSVAVVVTTLISIGMLGRHGGWSVGGVVGPLVAAGVALLIGLGYRALSRESDRREQLMRELLATRDQLVASEHEAGILAERARLAREIHDTLAQGLSSIQLLLHAAERTAPTHPGNEYIELARATAASNLADARRFIRELSPPGIEERGLADTLRRLADTQWAAQGLEVRVRVADIELPMQVQTALLRMAQGAVANVIQHAHATCATITLTADADRVRFVIADDGRGFDPADRERAGRSDSFGLRATRERVDQLGGTLTVDSNIGHGTTVTIDLAREPRP